SYTATVDTDSELEEALSEIEEFLPLVSRAPLTDEEFEASKPLDTRTTSSHSSASSNSTAPLSPDHPLTQTSPTPTLTRVLFHRRIARMAMRTQPTLSLGMSARITKAAALSPSSFHKRYRSFYETPSPSSLTIPTRKRYRGTFKLIEDTEDDSSDLDTEREGLEDEGSGSEDEGSGSEDKGSGSEEEEEAAPEGQQQAVSVVNTTADEPLGLGYEALRHRDLALGEGLVPSTFKIGQSSRSVLGQQRVEETPAPRIPTPASPEWSSGSLPVSPSSSYPVASPMTTLAATIALDDDEFLEEPEAEAREGYNDFWLIHDLLVKNTMMRHELQGMRGRIATLEQERSRRER
nr:hypothetical protein [Tanacetum cinerariifolium]